MDYVRSDNYKPTGDFKNECISTPKLFRLHSIFKQKLVARFEQKNVSSETAIKSSRLSSTNGSTNSNSHSHSTSSSLIAKTNQSSCNPNLNHSHHHHHHHHHHNNHNHHHLHHETEQKGCCSQTNHKMDLDEIYDHDSDDHDGHSHNHNHNHHHHHHHSHILRHRYKHDTSRLLLHDELWFNEEGQLNDGPACRCSKNARKIGIRHGIFPGEEPLEPCDLYSNCADRLFHYSIKINPTTNYVSSYPTKIEHNGSLYKFEGFSLLSHAPLINLSPCKMIRFNTEYTIDLIQEEVPPNFTVEGIELIKHYIFSDILELCDLDWRAYGDDKGCPRFHLYPRFTRYVQETDKHELLSVDAILDYLIRESNPLHDEALFYGEDWLNYRGRYKDMIVLAPKHQPSAIRIDQIDVENNVPVIVHFGLRPPQLSLAACPQCQRAWGELLEFRHLLANKPKVSLSDKRTLAQKEEKLLSGLKLQEYKAKAEMERKPIVLPCDKFYTTGLLCDVIQHAMIMPVIVYQIRFQHSLECLESIINHSFADKQLLQLALTHPSYRENYGTNPDHARNTLNNLGFRQPTYGDNRINHQTKKRGIYTLFTIMSQQGCQEETTSDIQHNERLEFLGDAVVEFLTSIHLYFMFPELEEGGLATYRAALVQNQHLAVLAKKLQLDKYMLYAHGSDLCHDLELRHAMANCFEALMAALFLDAGLEVADKCLANVLFDENRVLLDRWINYPKHPLQVQNPDGDRHLIDNIPLLKKLTNFERMTGIEFKCIRLLARAFTHRSIGFNNLTLGTNQRMEFLGDTVLQLIASEYLYKHFPGHHEGHLSLLRSSLVNNRTQTVVCDDLGMADYLNHRTRGPLRTKDRADLLEAFIGALYVDGGLDKCRAFCAVCFFPRLKDFIIHQSWNDPKSKLQQSCLTLRSPESREPDIPVYKVIETIGATNDRVYNVAVYFKDLRLATGKGPSIQDAEMTAATNALKWHSNQFPQLGNKRQRKVNVSTSSSSSLSSHSVRPAASVLVPNTGGSTNPAMFCYNNSTAIAAGPAAAEWHLPPDDGPSGYKRPRTGSK